MNIKKTKIYLGLLIILFSCENKDSIEFNDTKQVNKIPYAKNSTLNRFKGDNFIDIKLSRKAALLEVQDFKKELNINDFSDLKLSKNPVLILDIDKTPKFYEFIILDNSNKEIGTVSCFAKKEVPALIACVLPYVRDYKHKNALLFTAAYPNISRSRNTKENTSARGLNNIDLQEEFVVSENENKSFWSNVSKSKPEFMNSTISELKEEQKKITPQGRAWNEYYTIPSFKNSGLQRTIFSTNCGPGALTWAYRGLYTTYNNRYIPIHGDNSSANNNENILFNSSNKRGYYFDRDKILKNYDSNNDGIHTNDKGYSKLLDDIDEYRGTLLISDATTPANMDKAVSDIFPNHKIRRLGKGRGNVRNAIERGNPVYLLIVSPKDGKNLKGMHYLIAFGTKNRYTKFWIGGTHLTDSWLLVSDNGFTTSDNNYLPYYRNSHYLNLRRKTYARGEFIRK